MFRIAGRRLDHLPCVRSLHVLGEEIRNIDERRTISNTHVTISNVFLDPVIRCTDVLVARSNSVHGRSLERVDVAIVSDDRLACRGAIYDSEV